MTPQDQASADDELPPILGSWRNIYLIVIVSHILLIILFFFFSQAYA